MMLGLSVEILSEEILQVLKISTRLVECNRLPVSWIHFLIGKVVLTRITISRVKLKPVICSLFKL